MYIHTMESQGEGDERIEEWEGGMNSLEGEGAEQRWVKNGEKGHGSLNSIHLLSPYHSPELILCTVFTVRKGQISCKYKCVH